MRLLPLTDPSLAIVAALLLSTGSTSAQSLLSVDFQHTTTASPGVAQSGFETFNEADGGSAVFSTLAGDVTVTMIGLDGLLGGHFNRGGVSNGGSLTFADIYNDFAFKNGAAPQSMTLELSGAGIAATTSYTLTFYSYDSFNFGGASSTVDFTGASGTSGSASLVTPHDGIVPTNDDTYATSATFTSDGSGVLTIDLTANDYSAEVGVRLNAFSLDLSGPVVDTDNDDLPDDYENLWVEPDDLDVLSGLGDANADDDTLTDLEEFNLRGEYPLLDPTKGDSDGDTLKDGEEIAGAGSRPPTNPTLTDSDGDDLDDLIETNTGIFSSVSDTGTSPTLADSDGDGQDDGAEISDPFTDPNDRGDPPAQPPVLDGFLAVDFQNSNGVSIEGITQSGFVAFDNTHATGAGTASATYSTDAGEVTVELAGLDGLLDGLFNRGGVSNGGDLTFADIYNDFAFKNGGSPQSLTLTLSGAGISANTDYDLTLYSLDPLATQGSHSVAFTGAAIRPLQYDASILPTMDHQYSTTGTFSSDGTGVLTIEMVDTYTDATESTGIRLNAFVIGNPADSSFAITDITYDPDANTVTLTWRSRPNTTYTAKVSVDMSDWEADLEDSITAANDENLDDGDHITVTFPLTAGLKNETELFFRVEKP